MITEFYYYDLVISTFLEFYLYCFQNPKIKFRIILRNIFNYWYRNCLLINLFFKKIIMKKAIYLIIFIPFFISCGKEHIYQDSISESYKKALDTLINYDNYFIGEINGELLISVEQSTSGNSIGNTLQDSVTVFFDYSYHITNSEKSKTLYHSLRAYESINKFDLNTSNYKEFNDFYNLFNRSEIDYFRVETFKNLTPEINIYYNDYSRLIDNTVIQYKSADFDKPPYEGNNFHIESIKKIESPTRGIELTYSFNCTLFSDSNELIEIKNGKGKCSITY